MNVDAARVDACATKTELRKLRKNSLLQSNRRRNRLRHQGQSAGCQLGGAGGFACQVVFPQPVKLAREAGGSGTCPTGR
jgi:hypothetical protein